MTENPPPVNPIKNLMINIILKFSWAKIMPIHVKAETALKKMMVNFLPMVRNDIPPNMAPANAPNANIEVTHVT